MVSDQVVTVVLFATLVYELVGPVITKAALSGAGEIERQISVSGEQRRNRRLFRKGKKA